MSNLTMKRLVKQFIFGAVRNPVKHQKQTQNILSNVISRKLHSNAVPVKEIQIPVAWGHVSAKLWGSGDARPILALHGWQDNAGTWDPLIPHVYKTRPILAIDFPGHGLSSWFPAGQSYYPWDLPRLLFYLKDYFKWDKVSIMAHSMGSICSLRFACVFPDDVDFYVAIDSLVQDDYDLKCVIERYPVMFQKHLIDQNRLNKEPPAYSKEDMAKIWHLGTNKSVSMEGAYELMKRGAKTSTNDPNKYYFSRDPRLKHLFFNPESKLFVEGLAKRLTCPTMYVKAIDSPYATDEFSTEMREMIEKNNEKFECHFVPGTHHVHLNNPEIIAPLIEKFAQKHNFTL